MKTAISLPDVVFAEAETLARRLAKSRSQLYTEALIEYLAKHDPDTVTERLNEVLESIGQDPDAFATAAARAVLERVER
jgi:metal-responsive CopG/Arc/MetJ family transcriptional regulator